MTEESDDADSESPADERDPRPKKKEGQKKQRQESRRSSRLSSTPRTQSAKFLYTQTQVDAISNIMRFNIDKVMERDKTLTELVSRADNLDEAAGAFKNTAGKLKNTFWWKDFKTTIVLVVIGIIVVLIVIIYLIVHFTH